MRRGLGLGIGVVGVLLLGALGAIGWFGSAVAVRPPWYTHRTVEQGLRPMDPDGPDYFIWHGGYRDPTTDLGLPYERVEIPARDGSTLRGWWVPGAPGARVGVVAVHGGGADRREFLRHVPIFHAAGWPVVLFDCREHGISDGDSRGISLGLRESEDVSSVVSWAKAERGLETVVAIGTSQGGASVILAGAADPAIDVVIAENPFTSIRDLIADARLPEGDRVPGFAADLIAATTILRAAGPMALARPSPLEAVGEIAPRPLLLLHGSADAVVPVEHSRRLHAAAGPTGELHVMEGAEHAALFNHDAPAYRAVVIGFLARHGIEPAPGVAPISP